MGQDQSKQNKDNNNNNNNNTELKQKEPFLSKLSRKFRTSLLLFYGRHYLPVPHRHPIKLVICDVIPVVQSDNPSDEYVLEIQNKVMDVLHKLWNSDKKPEWETRQLVIN